MLKCWVANGGYYANVSMDKGVRRALRGKRREEGLNEEQVGQACSLY